MFAGITEASAYQAMTQGMSQDGEGPHYRRTTCGIAESRSGTLVGIPARELAERAGHSRPSMSLDVYSHVMPRRTKSAQSNSSPCSLNEER